MIHRRHLLHAFSFAGAILVVLCGTPPPSGSAQPASPEAALSVSAVRASVAEILPVVEQIRGLKFRRPVPVKVINDRQARRYLRARIRRFYRPRELRAEETAYKLLGLIPESMNMLGVFLDVMEEQAGGYYDPSRGSFVLLDDTPPALAGLLSSHELTHALEDQHFRLDEQLEKVRENADRVFAASAVHEGSASLVMTYYMAWAMKQGRLSEDDLAVMATTEATEGRRLAALPAVLRRPLLGSYVLGLSFLAQGGAEVLADKFPVDLVDRAHREPPASSEQILHPEKYWDPAARDLPEVLGDSGAGSLLGRRWKRVGQGVFGELVLGVLVGAPTPSHLIMGFTRHEAWSCEASRGWDGDRWELYERGRRRLLVVTTVWDTEQDAVEFFEALPSDGRLRALRQGRRVVLAAGAVPDPPETFLRAVARRPVSGS